MVGSQTLALIMCVRLAPLQYFLKLYKYSLAVRLLLQIKKSFKDLTAKRLLQSKSRCGTSRPKRSTAIKGREETARELNKDEVQASSFEEGGSSSFAAYS
jgi:hypothetical protein